MTVLDPQPTDALSVLRAQVAALLGQIDTGELPRPAQIRHGGTRGDAITREPGATWEPAHKVKVFTIDTEDGADAVFVTDVRYGCVDPSEWEAFTTADARRFGMALLAAADWAEQHRAQVPRLDRARAKREAVL